MAIKKKYRAAIIGCGRIGSEYDDDPKRKIVSSHAGAYSRLSRTELIAVADLDKEKLAKCANKWKVPSSYLDWRKMLSTEQIDILSVCTQSSSHFEIIKEAVAHDIKAIFCEKPVADSLEHASQIVAACKAKNIPLIIDHQRRFDPLYGRIKKFIDKGGLGEPQQAVFYYTAGISNSGSHLADILRFFFGEAAWVWGVFSKNSSPDPNDPNIDGMIEFKNGTRTTIHALDVKDYTIFETDIFGPKGRINITHAGFDADFLAVKPSKNFSGFFELYPAKFPLNKKVPHQFMINGVKHIVDCLDGKAKPDISTGEDGAAALEVVTALYLSAKNNGKKIKLPLALEFRNIILKSR